MTHINPLTTKVVKAVLSEHRFHILHQDDLSPVFYLNAVYMQYTHQEAVAFAKELTQELGLLALMHEDMMPDFMALADRITNNQQDWTGYTPGQIIQTVLNTLEVS